MISGPVAEVRQGKRVTEAAGRSGVRLYREVTGRKPPQVPLPAWLFKRFGFVGQDLTTMWRWLRTETIPLDTGTTRAIHPGTLTVQAWLRSKKQGEIELR